MKKSLPILCALVSCLGLYAQEVTVEGLIIPRDNEGMYVRNPNGQFEIKWTDKTQVALEVNTRLFKGLKEGTLDYQVPSSKEIIRFKLPKGPVTGVVGVRSKAQLEKKLKEAMEEKWIGIWTAIALRAKPSAANGIFGGPPVHWPLGPNGQAAHLDHPWRKI